MQPDPDEVRQDPASPQTGAADEAQDATPPPGADPIPEASSEEKRGQIDAATNGETVSADGADAAVYAESRRHTRRSFVLAGVGAAAGYGLYRLLDAAAGDEMQPIPIRRAFQFNAALSHGIFREHALAPTYPLSRAENLRVNGVYGLKKALVPESWRLQLVGVQKAERHPRYVPDVTAWEYRYAEADSNEDKGHDTKVDPNAETARKMAPESMLHKAEEDENHTGRMPRGLEEAGESHSTLSLGTPGLLLTMDDLLRLPRHEFVTQFKCIEGWSQIVHWAGVRMADFLESYPPEKINGKDPRYVYMETPDGDYYTGYDMNVMRHPQTLLATEMMGAPLTQFHGAPLRLHMPTKYGYKQIKRIGLILYTNSRPDDYWTRLGYDWYAGL